MDNTELPDLGRLVRTALLEMQARAVAVEAAVEMLLAAEAGRNPELPEAMKGSLTTCSEQCPSRATRNFRRAPVSLFTNFSGRPIRLPNRPKRPKRSESSRPCGTRCGAASDQPPPRARRPAEGQGVMLTKPM